MPRNKISDNIEGIVKYLLTKKYSYYVIQQELARMNLNVSKALSVVLLIRLENNGNYAY